MLAVNFDTLRDPVTEEPLVPEFSQHSKNHRWGPTGVLQGRTREYPVIGGVVVFRDDFVTEKVIAYAKKGHFTKAALEVIKAETKSRRAAAELLIRLRYPKLLQFNGSPFGRLRGPAGIYFRYR